MTMVSSFEFLVKISTDGVAKTQFVFTIQNDASSILKHMRVIAKHCYSHDPAGYMKTAPAEPANNSGWLEAGKSIQLNGV